MSTSSHTNWKGCAMCKPNKRRGQGRKARDPIAVVRKMGKKKYGRHDLPS